MILLAAALFAVTPAPPPPELATARTAWTGCTEGLWPQAEAGTTPTAAADSVLDYCKPQHDAWLAAALSAIDSGPGTPQQKAAARRRATTQDNGARARLIRLITQQRRRYR